MIQPFSFTKPRHERGFFLVNRLFSPDPAVPFVPLPLRVRFLCLPDLDQPIGGGKQIHRQVEQLSSLGWDAAVVTEKDGFRPSWFETTAPSLSFEECRRRGDFLPDAGLVVLPETYLGIDLSSYRGVDLSRMARVVFNQNAYYSYMGAANEPLARLARFYDAAEVLQVLCVSEDSHHFLRQNLGLPMEKLSRIINAVEPIFSPDPHKSNLIHWLPRKHPDHALAVLLGLPRGRLTHARGWNAAPLTKLSHQELAGKLNAARIFLSFGHPEGFGLPVAEAMAAGCYVIGYSGGGGEELFRLGLARPVPFGDWSGYLEAIQRALRAFSEDARETELRLQRQALAMRTLYSHEQEQQSIAAAWNRIADAWQAWSTQQGSIAEAR